MMNKGFTLVELLVAISIVAILAVVGLVAYNSVFGRARDARRIQEVDAVQKAMEKKYSPVSGYLVLAAGDFASGSIPADPAATAKCGSTGNLMCRYCGTTSGEAVTAIPDEVVDVNGCVTTGGFDTLNETYPVAGKFYTVCATLETPIGNTGTAPSYLYCKSNLQ